jgi:hypothetical protein
VNEAKNSNLLIKQLKGGTPLAPRCIQLDYEQDSIQMRSQLVTSSAAITGQNPEAEIISVEVCSKFLATALINNSLIFAYSRPAAAKKIGDFSVVPLCPIDALNQTQTVPARR